MTSVRGWIPTAIIAPALLSRHFLEQLCKFGTRSLHSAFDSNALPCCYSYWIDTTTQEGKNTYALILSFSAQGRSFWFDISDYTTPQQITWARPWRYRWVTIGLKQLADDAFGAWRRAAQAQLPTPRSAIASAGAVRRRASTRYAVCSAAEADELFNLFHSHRIVS
jgi:hypothetical protein